MKYFIFDKDSNIKVGYVIAETLESAKLRAEIQISMRKELIGKKLVLRLK